MMFAEILTETRQLQVHGSVFETNNTAQGARNLKMVIGARTAVANASIWWPTRSRRQDVTTENGFDPAKYQQAVLSHASKSAGIQNHPAGHISLPLSIAIQ
jgi:hypothetical protein